METWKRGTWLHASTQPDETGSACCKCEPYILGGGWVFAWCFHWARLITIEHPWKDAMLPPHATLIVGKHISTRSSQFCCLVRSTLWCLLSQSTPPPLPLFCLPRLLCICVHQYRFARSWTYVTRHPCFWSQSAAAFLLCALLLSLFDTCGAAPQPILLAASFCALCGRIGPVARPAHVR